MDEWIAVGDAEFRKKTHDRLQEITARSGIVVLASHDYGLLRAKPAISHFISTAVALAALVSSTMC